MQRNNQGLILSKETSIVSVICLFLTIPISCMERIKYDFFRAIENDDIQVLEKLERRDCTEYEGRAQFLRNENGDTLLHHAARRGASCDVIRLLLDKGAQIDRTTRGGFIVLHLAAMNGHADIVDTLFCNGHPSIDAVVLDGSRHTALHLAAQNGHLGVVKVLLANGASINACALNGLTPLDLAEQKGFGDVVDVLIRKGAQRGATAQAKCPKAWLDKAGDLIWDAFSDIDKCDRLATAKAYIEIASRDPHELLNEIEFMERLTPHARLLLSSIFSEYTMDCVITVATCLLAGLDKEEQDGAVVMLREALKAVNVSIDRNLASVEGGVDPALVVLDTLVKLVSHKHITPTQSRFVQCQVALIKGYLKIEEIYSSYQTIELLNRDEFREGFGDKLLGERSVNELSKRRIQMVLSELRPDNQNHQRHYEALVSMLTDVHFGLLLNPHELLNLFNKPRYFVAHQCKFIETLCTEDQERAQARIKIICDLLEEVTPLDTLEHKKEFDEFVDLLDHETLAQLPPLLINIARFCPHILEGQPRFLAMASKKVLEDRPILWHYYAALLQALSQYTRDLGE